jgi:phosphoribosylformylglycinamidine synthase subunit PurL
VQYGGDAAVVRVDSDSLKGLAICVDVRPRLCEAHPVRGGEHAVAETWRNLISVGADPIAITDNLNFGNPERPEIMGQFVGCIQGMATACRELNYPVVSGNVSLYNETNGQAILPTPAIGGVGLLTDIRQMATIGFKEKDAFLYLIGDNQEHLGCSDYLYEVQQKQAGIPALIHWENERKNGAFILQLIREYGVKTVHDVSGGGVLVAATEMALAGGRGVSLMLETTKAALFGETTSCYLVAINADMAEKMESLAQAAGVCVQEVGTIKGDDIAVIGDFSVALSAIKTLHETPLQAYFS